MTAIITRTTIESAAYDNIFEIMDTRSNIADPRGSSAGGRTFIYDSDPLMKALDFSGMPYIVLELPELEYDKESTDGKHKFITWKHTITVRTVKDGSSGSRVNTGRSDMQAICDDLNETFNSRTIKDELRLLEIEGIKLTKLSTDTLTLDQQLSYEARYELEYRVRLQTSV